MNNGKFQALVWQYYREHGRDLPWRQPQLNGIFDPYSILVSEFMLQQTQVPRVIPKYRQFLDRFPSIDDLATASLAEVLAVWNGLGYNRRAKFLWQTAQAVRSTHGSQIPCTVAELTTLPGIGTNTAGAIIAYAYNQPVIFVETNIRTVFIHHFFADVQAVPDAVIAEKVTHTLDTQNVREWYWALMDYGTFLRNTVGNVARSSAVYTKQTPFEGSKRQIRGQVLRLLAQGAQDQAALAELVPDKRLGVVLQDLKKERMIAQTGQTYHL